MNKLNIGILAVLVAAMFNAPAFAFANLSGVAKVHGPSAFHMIKLSRDEKCALATRELLKHRSRISDKEWRKYGKMHKQNCLRKSERRVNKRACKEYARKNGFTYNQKTNMMYDKKTGWRNNCVPDLYEG